MARLLVGLVGSCLVFPAQLHAELVIHPSALGTSTDVGQIMSGKFLNNAGEEVKVEKQFITRTGVYLTESGTLNKKLTVQVTLGGLFWFPLPEVVVPYTYRTIQFGPGIGQAQAVYKFGRPENPFASLQFGLFPIKYNSDSKNLGEYLYRSGTYPGVLYTGGWSYLNSAAYMAQGLRLTSSNFGGKLTHELSLTMERDLERNKDLTPGYVLTWKPASFLELGGGVVWAHAIPIGDDSVLTPETRNNAYNKNNDSLLSMADRAKPGYLYFGPGDTRNDSRVVAAGDPLVGTVDPITGQTIIDDTTNGTPKNQLDYYTFKGFKTVARFSLNFGSLLGMGPEDFKLYGEWALLGIKDYPFFYEDKTERMPMMLGVNIPTFKLLDMLSLEVEYHKSRFRNTMFSVLQDQQMPWPLASGSEDPFQYDLNDARYASNPTLRDSVEKAFKKDDWKWSIYARKQITQGMTLHAQAASDHLRHIGIQIVPIPAYFPATERSGDWYYVLRLEFGI